ncbi:hypothetical protein ILYODFUR_027627 [Ilyodon furcidens]|uniref:Uncharacterized protein n=1 Tax=Ilyodon furcidens TaxID=33524 RepID=A0ABV0T145_9TELE
MFMFSIYTKALNVADCLVSYILYWSLLKGSPVMYAWLWTASDFLRGGESRLPLLSRSFSKGHCVFTAQQHTHTHTSRQLWSSNEMVITSPLFVCSVMPELKNCINGVGERNL